MLEYQVTRMWIMVEYQSPCSYSPNMEVWDWGKRLWSLERFLIGICEDKCCTFHSQASEFVFTQYFFSIIKHAGLRKLQVLGDWECGLRSLQGHFHRSILQRTLATAFSCRGSMQTRSISLQKKLAPTYIELVCCSDWKLIGRGQSSGKMQAPYWLDKFEFGVHTRVNTKHHFLSYFKS